MKSTRCVDCGTEIAQKPGPGRSKLWCDSCRKPARRTAESKRGAVRRRERAPYDPAKERVRYGETGRLRYREAREAKLQEAGLSGRTACDCCGVDPIPPRRDGGDGRCVDHDHESGAIRGILCPRCNIERGAIEAAIRSGRLTIHTVAIHRFAAPVRPEKPAGQRRKKVEHPELFGARRAD